MKWKKLTPWLAVSEHGHKAIKTHDGCYYSIFAPCGYFLGVIYQWSDRDGFLGCGSFKAPQEQSFLF